ncbi:MAG: carboxypeptidase-like regulatory domain-containing protein [Bacteroidia bacterium]
MNKLYTLFFLFITLNVSSQEVTGLIRDRSNLKGIAYASVFYKKNNVGTYTDSSGNFKIKKIIEDTLVISSMGFEKFLISAHNIKDFQNISLSPVTINLNEVVVKGSKPLKIRHGKKIYLGNLSSKRYNHISGMKGRTVAYLIKPDVATSGQIKYIHYGVKAEAPAIVRAHIYTIDAYTGKPGEDLLKNQEFLEVKSGSKNLTVDLSHLGIEFPKEGIYVGLEWIGEINSSKSVNISPTYTNSKSVEPTTVYIRFMDKNWEPALKGKVNLLKGQKEKKTGPEFYFEKPNFKITLIQ